MGNLYTEYDADLSADIEFGGVPLTILSDLHPKMRAMNQWLQKKYRHNLSGSVSEEVTEAIELKKVSIAVAGFPKPELVVDRDGKPIPYSVENVVKMMKELPHLRQDVLFAVLTREAFRKEGQAALGEASAPPSGPT